MKQSWLLLAVLVVAFPAAATEMYSWTDAHGVKHFSDSPPPANVTKAQKLKVKGGLTTSSAAEEESADAATMSAGPALAAAAGYSAEDIQRNCTIARKNLDALDAQQPALDADGNPVDAEAAIARQAQIDKAKQQTTLFCASK